MSKYNNIDIFPVIKNYNKNVYEFLKAFNTGICLADDILDHKIHTDYIVELMACMFDSMNYLDKELAKDSPDFILCMRLQRELDFTKNTPTNSGNRDFEGLLALRNEQMLKYHKQALKNLDEDGHNKPIIRQKLLGLINNPLKK